MYDGEIALYDDEIALYDNEIALYDNEVALYDDKIALYYEIVFLMEVFLLTKCLFDEISPVTKSCFRRNLFVKKTFFSRNPSSY